MSPRSVLITGANRGIGLGLVKAFLADKDVNHVFAGTRNLSSQVINCLFPGQKLFQTLSDISDPRLHLIELDVNCDNSIKEAVYKVSPGGTRRLIKTGQIDSIVGQDGLNLLINNAGIATEYCTDQKPKREIMTSVLVTNAVSVTILTQVLISPPLVIISSSSISFPS